MSIHAELLELMQDATYRQYAGQDAVGNNTYGPPRTIKARMEKPSRSMMTRGADGGTVATSAERSVMLIVDYVSPGVVERGKITPVDGVEYRIVSVVTHYDENGPYYQELQCSTNMER